MRILFKAYHYGNNAPPVAHDLMKAGHEVKVFCMYKFSLKELLAIHSLSPLLNESDLLLPSFSTLEKYFIRFCRKLNIPLGEKYHIRKIRKVIDHFQPDVIFHHGLDDNSYLLLKTGFHPQAGIPYSYGGYLEAKTNRKDHKYRFIFKNMDRFFTCFASQLTFYIREGIAPEKFYPEHAPPALPNFQQLINWDDTGIDQIRKKFGISNHHQVVSEFRSLRSMEGGAKPLIDAIEMLIGKYPNLYLIMGKGVLGNNQVVAYYQAEVEKRELSRYIRIITEESDYDEMINIFRVSQIFVSLLKMDQLGFSLLEATTQGCLLLLSDLPDYHSVFGNHAEYVNPAKAEDIAQALEKLLQMDTTRRECWVQANKEWITNNLDPSIATARTLKYLQETVDQSKQRQ